MGMTKKERAEYNHWLWNLEAEDFNKMNQSQLAKIAEQYQRQFKARAKALDRLEADTGISSDALRQTRKAFENTRFITGPQFKPSSHIKRGGKIRYSVPRLRSIVANYADFFREYGRDPDTVRTNTVEGTIENYERMVARLKQADKQVSKALGRPPTELTPADYQAMWRAYDLFKELYVEAFAILQSDLVQKIMYQTYQEAPSGTSTLELVQRMFEKGMGYAPRNGDLSSKYRDENLPEEFFWGDSLEKRLQDKGLNIIEWHNNL